LLVLDRGLKAGVLLLYPMEAVGNVVESQELDESMGRNASLT
jgi:hypothetical protein